MAKTPTLDDDDDFLGRIPTGHTEATSDEKPRPAPEEVLAELERTWVRHRLGQNRGEVRPYHGPAASWDALLDQIPVATTKED